ncbi:MAG: MFS transporter [Candidatus Eisenbacteria bacterium]|jgi:MFS family permease|nr:MFS transporter [Candidatus Eisenbacteria bacterium]
MRRSVVEFLGLRRSMLGLLGMVVLVGMGEKMAERFLPIYLVALGGGPLVIGLLNGMDNLLSALYSYPGGYLAERLGTRRSLLIFDLMAMAGFVIVILIPTWQAVIVGSVLFLSWTAISLPGTMKLVSIVLPKEKRTMGVSLHSLVRRVPMALGPLVGGALIAARGEREGVRLAFVAALCMAAVAAWLQQVLIEDDRKTRQNHAVPSNSSPRALWRRMHPSLKNLLVADILVRFCEQIPYAFVVIWCMKTITEPVSAFSFGVLTAVEMATAVLIYIPIAYLADRGNKKPFVVMTFVFFSVFPLVLLFSRSFWPLVIAFVIRGLKEFGEPTRKALIMDLAPDDAKAATFGLYYLVRDVVVSMAAFGGSLLWLISPEVNFIAASAFGLLGTIWFALRGRDLGPGRQGS